MKIICNQCEFVIDRDKYIDEQLVEEYKNIFGTICPRCGNLIKPSKKPFFNEQKDSEIKMLQEQMREKLKNKITGEK